MKRSYMQSLLRQFHLSDLEQSASLREQREILLNAVLVSSSILGTLLYALSFFPVFEKGLSPAILGFYTGVYLGVLAITFIHRLPYRVRMGGCLLIFYLLGVYNLLMNGFNVDAGLFLLTFVAMSSLFLGVRGGLSALLLSLASATSIGFSVTHERIQLRMGLPQTNPMLWFIGGNIFLLMGVTLTMTISGLLRSLDRNLAKSIQMGTELQHTLQALASSEERFRSLIEYSTDIIAVIERNGAIRFASPSIERLLGYTGDEIIGKSIYDIIHPEDQELAIAALAPGAPQEVLGPTIEVLIRHKNGSWHLIEVRGREMYDNPAVQGIVINCQDITERKEAERLLKKAKDELERRVAERTAELHITNDQLMELIVHSPSVIYSAELTGNFRIMTITRNVTALLGYAPAQITEQPDFWKCHVHPEDAERACAGRQGLCAQKRLTYEYRFLNHDGEYRMIRDVTALLSNPEDGMPRMVGSWTDITDQ